MKASKLRELSREELVQQLEEARKDLFGMRIQKATAQVEHPLRMRNLRRDIARVKTVLRARESQ
jgi:large subunit ribosomal protein L29